MPDQSNFETGAVADNGPLLHKHRNKLQICLAKEMIGHEPTAVEMLSWADEYAKDIGDIVDDPTNVEIRSLAQAGSYEQAAKEARALLGRRGSRAA